MHPRSMARERHQSANPAMAGITEPSFVCYSCGERRSIRGGYVVVSADRKKRICRQCRPKEKPPGMTVGQIMDRIGACTKPGQRFALVVRNGLATLVKTNTDKFKAIERLESEIIVGVYDILVEEDQIRGDLECVGVAA